MESRNLEFPKSCRARVLEVEEEPARLLLEDDLVEVPIPCEPSFAEAKSVLRRAIKVAPEYPDAHNNLAVAHYREQDLEQAITRAREAVRLKPDHPQFQLNLGSFLRAAGRPADALPHLERAVALQPENPAAIRVLMQVRTQLGR